MDGTSVNLFDFTIFLRSLSLSLIFGVCPLQYCDCVFNAKILRKWASEYNDFFSMSSSDRVAFFFFLLVIFFFPQQDSHCCGFYTPNLIVFFPFFIVYEKKNVLMMKPGHKSRARSISSTTNSM